MPRYQELRLKYGYTQEYVAEAIGVSRITYIRYENGERQIKVPELIALANLYHVSIDYILGVSDSPAVVLDTKKDPSPEERAQVVATAAAALENQPTVSLSEEDRQWLREYVDSVVNQALARRSTPSDDPAGSPGQNAP